MNSSRPSADHNPTPRLAPSAALPSTKQSQQPSALHDAQPPLQPAVIHTPSTPVAVLAHSSSSSDLLLSIATMPSSSLCLGTLAYSTTLTVTNYQSYKEILSQLVMLFLNKLRIRKVEQSTFQILKKRQWKKTTLSLSRDWNFTYVHLFKLFRHILQKGSYAYIASRAKPSTLCLIHGVVLWRSLLLGSGYTLKGADVPLDLQWQKGLKTWHTHTYTLHPSILGLPFSTFQSQNLQCFEVEKSKKSFISSLTASLFHYILLGKIRYHSRPC